MKRRPRRTLTFCTSSIYWTWPSNRSASVLVNIFVWISAEYVINKCIEKSFLELPHGQAVTQSSVRSRHIKCSKLTVFCKLQRPSDRRNNEDGSFSCTANTHACIRAHMQKQHTARTAPYAYLIQPCIPSLTRGGVDFLLFLLACLHGPGPWLMYIIYHYLYPDGILIVLLQCLGRAIHQRHRLTPTFAGAHT